MKTLKEDFYFKKIDIPNYCLIDEELKTFYKKTSLYGNVVILQTNILKYFPLLSDWFNTHSLSVDFIGCFILKGKGIMSPHIDYCAQRLALNFPLDNCENSKTIFYEFKGKKEVIKTKKTQNDYFVVDQDSCTKSEEFTLDVPSLINIKKAHNVINYSDKPRVSLSFRFKNDPWFLIF